MKVSVLIIVVVLTLSLCHVDAWWGSRGSKTKRVIDKVKAAVKNTVDKVKSAVKKTVDKVKATGKFAVGAAKGAGEMAKAYKEMRDSNVIGSDKYFHAKGNHNAAKHGPGGKFAAKVISDARETWQSDVSGRGDEDTAADQAANKWGRNGGDPNKFRPKGLPKKYRK